MPVQFTRDDLNNLELVRSVILHRLKDDRRYQQMYSQWADDEVRDFVTFQDIGVKDRFFVLENEVLWQLIVQGVITPGMNSSNPAFPWFRITDYGHQVLEDERLTPHDPAGYPR